jgi:cyclopropane fatty-acyl-phospholipid synthase-like methyltransferase
VKPRGRNEVSQILAKIDLERLHEIQKRHEGSNVRYAKYADVEHWLAINLPRIRELKLDQVPPKQILDLGCGAGFFLFLAKQFGHACLGLDVGDYPLSNELIELFGIDRLTWRISAFEPLPDFGRQFDLITAFSAAFNRDADQSRGWTLDEWDYFLNDLHRHLNADGQVLLEINSGKDGRYFLPEVRDFLVKRGARVEGERVYFGS